MPFFCANPRKLLRLVHLSPLFVFMLLNTAVCLPVWRRRDGSNTARAQYFRKWKYISIGPSISYIRTMRVVVQCFQIWKYYCPDRYGRFGMEMKK